MFQAGQPICGIAVVNRSQNATKAVAQKARGFLSGTRCQHQTIMRCEMHRGPLCRVKMGAVAINQPAILDTADRAWVMRDNAGTEINMEVAIERIQHHNACKRCLCRSAGTGDGRRSHKTGPRARYGIGLRCRDITDGACSVFHIKQTHPVDMGGVTRHRAVSGGQQNIGKLASIQMWPHLMQYGNRS